MRFLKVEFDSERALVCLVKALLMFASSFGTIACVLSAFSIEANYVLLFFFLLGASLIMSFLRYSLLIFDISYLAIMAVFIALILRYRTLVNSGYQAMTNIIREAYQEYFGLNYTNEAVEAVSDRYRAVTAALLFLGCFLLILLNIAISSHMSVLLNILLTLPFLQLGLYIEKRPSLLAMALLLFSYVSTAAFKRTGHYRLVSTSKKDSPTRVKKNVVSYKTHGKTMAQLLIICFIFVTVFSLVVYPIAAFATPEDNGTSSLKAATDRVVENITQSGFASLFNRYEAAGGVSGGKLGGVARVSADYETDLEVTFVPTTMEELYLKAYTGATYTANQWLAPEGEATDIDDSAAFAEAGALAAADTLCGKMQIRNIDADTGYVYLPYYTSQEDADFAYQIDHGTILGNIPVGKKYTLTYYPYNELTQEKETAQALPEGYLDAYLDIPEAAAAAIAETKAAIGDTDGLSDTLQKISKYLEEQCTYTVSPGSTPYNKDFVSYFLTEQKKGYCAHFATAGTLLCRAYGIPARYAEGYAVSVTDLAESTVEEDKDPDDWISGDNELEDAKVVTVDVPDANAHAWTEIYIEGFGWSPVDFTPASSDADESEEYSSLLSLFRGLFSIAGESGSSQNSGSASDGSSGVGLNFSLSDNLFVVVPILVVFAGILLFFPLKRLLGRIRKEGDIRRAYNDGEYDRVLEYYYGRIASALAAIKKDGAPPVLPTELIAQAASLAKAKAEESKRAAEIFERGVYGPSQIDKSEADRFLSFADAIVLTLKKSRQSSENA